MRKPFEIPNNQTIRELINDLFLIDLPIKGGSGESIVDAIILEITEENDYVATEYEVLKFLGYCRSILWKSLGQTLICVDDKKYDCLKIRVSDLMNRNVSDWIEEYYFDITDCFIKNAKLVFVEME
jgi:hypothetical protein